MADAPDSKSGGVNPREGSSPSSGTNEIKTRSLFSQPQTVVYFFISGGVPVLPC